jgi:hypothetical protein
MQAGREVGRRTTSAEADTDAEAHEEDVCQTHALQDNGEHLMKCLLEISHANELHLVSVENVYSKSSNLNKR